MRTLFRITEDLNALADMLTEAGGEISDDEQGSALESWFKELGEERDQKIDNYCRLIATVTARANARTEELARLGALVDTDENTIKRLKTALHNFMLEQGVTKIETPLHRLTIAKNGGKSPLVIPEAWRHDAATAPEQYHRRMIRLDVDAIRTDLESGQDVPGCRIEERGTHLRIK